MTSAKACSSEGWRDLEVCADLTLVNRIDTAKAISRGLIPSE